MPNWVPQPPLSNLRLATSRLPRLGLVATLVLLVAVLASAGMTAGSLQVPGTGGNLPAPHPIAMAPPRSGAPTYPFLSTAVPAAPSPSVPTSSALRSPMPGVEGLADGQGVSAPAQEGLTEVASGAIFQPYEAGFDPVSGLAYLAANGQAPLLLNPLDDRTVGTLSTPADLSFDAVYDAADSDMYVSGFGAGEVFIFNASTNSLVSSISGFEEPSGLAYDPVDQDVYVAMDGGDVAVLHGASWVATTDPPAGYTGTSGFDIGVAYDGQTNEVYSPLVDGGDLDLVPIQGVNYTTSGVATLNDEGAVAVPGVTYDPANGDLFVNCESCTGSDDVYIVDPLTDASTAVPAGDGAYESVYDSANGLMYVGEADAVVAVSSSGAVVASTSFPAYAIGITLDPTNGQLVTACDCGDYYVYDTELAERAPTWVSAGPAQNLSSVQVGQGPEGEAVDPATSQVWVAESGASKIAVLDAQGANVAATLDAGTTPVALAYDPDHQLMAAANYGSGTVTLWNATSDTYVGTVSVGVDPDALVYDTADHLLYVANRASDTVSVIRTATEALRATVPVGVHPDALAFNATNGTVFVANQVTDNITYINATWSSVKANVSVGSSPDAIYWDAARGELYVAEGGSSSVDVLQVSTQTVEATLRVQLDPSVLTSDGAGTLYVANTGSGSLSFIDLTNDSVLTNLSLGGAPSGLAWDPQTWTLYASNDLATGNGLVTLVRAGAGSGQSSVDVGQALLLDGDLVAWGSGGLQATAASSPSGGVFCSEQPLDVPQSLGPFPNDVSFLCVAEAPGTYSLWTNVTDSSGSTVWGFTSLLVNADPVVAAAPVPSVDTLDVGQSLTFLAVTSGGSGVAAYRWTAPVGLGCVASRSASLSCVPSSPTGPGGVNVSLQVEDTDGVWSPPVASAPNVVVSAPLAVVLSASATSLDVGQSLTLTASATSGSGTYTAYLWAGLPVAGCTGTTTATVTCTPTAAGTWNVAVTVTDSNGGSESSSPLALSIDPALSVSTPSAAQGTTSLAVSSADVGQNVLFSVAATGGSGAYTSYAWSGLPTDCTATTTADVACHLEAADVGTLTLSAVVTDSNGATSGAGPSLTFVVDPAPAVSAPSWGASGADVGQTIALTTTVTSPGSGVSAILWIPTGPGLLCMASGSPSTTCTASAPGAYEVMVEVEDTNGASASVNSTSLVVSAAPVVSLHLSSTTPTVGTSITLTATVTGGASPLAFVWSGLPSGCSGSATVTCSPADAGTYLVSVTVTDGNGVSDASAPVLLSVSPAAAPTFLGLPQAPGVLFLALDLVLLVLVAVLLLLYLRRGKASPRAGEPVVAASGAALEPPPPRPPEETAPVPPSAAREEEKDQMTLDPEPAPTPPRPEGEEYSET